MEKSMYFIIYMIFIVTILAQSFFSSRLYKRWKRAHDKNLLYDKELYQERIKLNKYLNVILELKKQQRFANIYLRLHEIIGKSFSLNEFKPGDYVIYVDERWLIRPPVRFSDCEFGIVSSVNSSFVFVHFYESKNGVLCRRSDTSAACRTVNLFK